MIVPRRSPVSFGRIVERMAQLSAPRHRELVRGMVSELESIDEPAERRRFALGAIAAIVRLTLSRHRGTSAFAGTAASEVSANSGSHPMSILTTRQLVRRHAAPFIISFVSMTLLLVANIAVRRVPLMSERGASTGTIVEMFVLALPFIVAMTLPMAAFIATSWVFTRLGAGTLATAQREHHGVRRLLACVLGVGVGIAAVALVSNTLILPRANARLAAVFAGAPQEPNDRTMTIGELRNAARIAHVHTGPDTRAWEATYEVEIQKKFALAAACVVLALAGAALGLRFPRGGIALVLGGGIVAFSVYYVSIVAGEQLADRQVISPFLAMWTTNALFLAVVMLLVWSPRTARREESLAIGG